MRKEDLNQHPVDQVRLICGVFDAELPTGSEILRKNRKKYGRPVPLAYNAGFKSTSRQGENLSTFMEGCPTPVFFVRHEGYFYPLDKKKEIKAFFKSKKKKI